MHCVLFARFPDENLTFGIIAPYSQQIKTMRDQFRSRFPGVLQGSNTANRVEISTVDGFQGREMDIIIFTCVRAPDANGGAQSSAGTRGIGFLSEWRRLNVAITRAKYGLWMIGHADTLRQDDHWRELIEEARARNVLLTVHSPDQQPWDAPSIEHQEPPALLSSPTFSPLPGADEEYRSPRRDGRDRPDDGRGGERRGRDPSWKHTSSKQPSRGNGSRGRRDDSRDRRASPPRGRRDHRDDSRDRRGGSRFSRGDSRDRGQIRYVKLEDDRDYNGNGNGNGNGNNSKRRRGDSREGRRSRF